VKSPSSPQIADKFSFAKKIGSAQIVLLGFADNRVFALDATGQLVQWYGTTAERSQLTRDVVAAGYSPERDVIAITDSEGTIRLFSRETATLVEPPLVGHSLAAVSVVFAQKGNVLVSGSFDTSVMVWDLQRAHPLQVAIHRFDGAPKAAYDTQGSLYATVASSSAIDTWELLEGEPQERRVHRSWPVKGRPTFAISEDASRIAWATEKDAWLWSDSWSASRHVVSGSLVMRMTFTRDGKFLAFADRTNRLMLSNDQGALKWTVQTTGDLVTTLSFSADGRYLAAGDLKGTLSAYQRDTGERILEQRAVHAGFIHSLAFDRSKAIASGGGGGDRNIVMHELESGTRTVIARGLHRGPIGALAFDSSGTLFASAANDGTVVLWDRAALRPLGPGLTGHGSFPNEVRFSPDGRRLASADDDSVIVWNVDPRAWIKIACDIAGRELTREEWEEASIDDEYRGVCAGNDNGGGWWRAFVRRLF
jgi:WD40 repeat protein